MAAAVDAHTTAWLHAIRRTNHAAARGELRRDQDVNVRGAGGETALHVAAELGQPGKTRSLLRERADASAIDDRGRTPLMVAQEYMQTEIVRQLIDHETLVSALAIHLGRTPTLNQIHDATFQRRWSAFRDPVLTRQREGAAKLIDAARAGDLATVRRLVEGGDVHIDSVDQSTEETAFSAALAGGWQFVCDYLLANGAHAYAPCVVNGRTQSSLLTAVTQGNVSFVRRLLMHRVLLWRSKYDPRTCALSEAVLRGTNEMIDVLLEAGVRFDWASSSLSFPLFAFSAIFAGHLVGEDKLTWQRLIFACWRQDWLYFKHLLATHKELQDREKMATNGTYALYLAVYHQNEEIVTDLLARGAEINTRMGLELWAMAAAVRVDSVRMVRLLLKHGGDIRFSHAGRQGMGITESLLAVAVHAGSVNCTRFLLSIAILPEERDQVMKIAAQQGDQELVRQLLDIALPSTENAFLACVFNTSCPMMLDLLLSRCCAERYLLSSLVPGFQYDCHQAEADRLAVFVAHGIDVNAQVRPLSALHYSVSDVYGGKPEVVKLLVDSGANVNSQDSYGQTALGLVEQMLQRASLPREVRLRFEASRDVLRAASAHTK